MNQKYINQLNEILESHAIEFATDVATKCDPAISANLDSGELIAYVSPNLLEIDMDEIHPSKMKHIPVSVLLLDIVEWHKGDLQEIEKLDAIWEKLKKSIDGGIKKAKEVSE